MKKVLVTGASGQLGLSISKRAFDHPNFAFTFTDVQELDITNSTNVSTIFKENKFDYCINCAAYTAVDKAESDEGKAFLINATAVKLLAEACKISETTLIHVSTDFVFDGTNSIPYTEEDTPNPQSVYGASKLKGEQFVQAILQKCFIVRTSWLYSEYGNNFVKTMLRLAQTRQEISVVNDQIGSPTYAGDLADFILRIISQESTNYGLYHFSNLGEISWFDFTKEIMKQFKKDIRITPIPSSEFPTQAKRPKYSVLDTSKASKIFNPKNWQKSLLKLDKSLML